MAARYAAVPCLLLASGLMGMTYPWWWRRPGGRPRRRASRGAVRAEHRGGGGRLPGAGFAGIGLVGVRGTALVAAAVNLLCGAGALLLGARRARGPAGRFRLAGSRDGAGDTQGVRPGRALCCDRLLAAGRAGLAAEILWTRALIPYLNSSTYAFTAILTVFLLALAAGSGAASRAAGRCRRAQAAGLRCWSCRWCWPSPWRPRPA